MRVFKILVKVALYALLVSFTALSSGESFVFTYQPAGEQDTFIRHIRGQYSYDRQISEVQKREPAYKSKQPMRYCLRLGNYPADNIYTAVIDQSKGAGYAYDRLYFDFNNNEDLTDDQPVDGVKAGDRDRTWLFKDLKVKLKIGDIEVPYQFNAELMDYGMFKVFAIKPACYYKGEIKLNSKSYKAVVLDFNTNGLVNDKFELAIPARAEQQRGSPAVTTGDKVLIDRNDDGKFSMDDESIEQVSISKYLREEGKFHNLVLNYLPAKEEKGSQLQVDITPAVVTTGKLELGKHLKRVDIASREQGYFSLGNEKLVEVPVGEYGIADVALGTRDKKGKELKVETGTIYGEVKKFDIKANEKTILPAGYPLRVKVDLEVKGAEKSFLDLFNLSSSSNFTIVTHAVGIGDEEYRRFQAGNESPPPPRFEVLDERDKVVMSGKLNYG